MNIGLIVLIGQGDVYYHTVEQHVMDWIHVSFRDTIGQKLRDCNNVILDDNTPKELQAVLQAHPDYQNNLCEVSIGSPRNDKASCAGYNIAIKSFGTFLDVHQWLINNKHTLVQEYVGYIY